MPITILDYVKSVVGDKDFYTAEDCLVSGVDIIGGCQRCQATIACHNAYPSASGYWRCADCIGDTGFATVADFTARNAAAVTCPSCGNIDTISEIRITASEDTEAYALECGDCGQVWQS
jgi:DNA-directed RNA polymerase subunit M/transcription elongation factor TFIIS